MPSRLDRTVLASVGFVVCALFASHVGAQMQQDVLEPLPDLTAAQRADFLDGRRAFEARVPGFGPLMNGKTCGHCHHIPDTGGAAPRYRDVALYGRFADGGFDPLIAEGGPVLQHQSNSGLPKEMMPAHANVMALRRAPALYGLGLIGAIPDLAILANLDPDDRDGDGVRGRTVFNEDGRVKRFGSQLFAQTLRDFVQGALFVELGVTGDEVSSEQVALLRDFLAFAAPIPSADVTDEVRAGEEIFESIGCATCHVPHYVTDSGPFVNADGELIDVPALQGVAISPYSDFLLHDMGSELDDKISLGEARSSELRTTPLWGVRFRMGVLMHDGRAMGLDQAIVFHGGEGRRARDAYLRLSGEERRALTAFLGAL